MPSIIKGKDFRPLQNLPFCYLCGKAFAIGEARNKDHVPPRSCFALIDRTPPLLLPTHQECNAARNVSDEMVGQFLSIKHRRIPAPKNRRLKFTPFRHPNTGAPMVALTGVDMYGEIERWVRALHAALYQEPCAPNTRFGIQTPFPIAVPSQAGLVPDKVRPQHLLFVKFIKDNRTAQNLDRLVCNNGKLIYECVWHETANGTWVCIFALDIYQWKDLGDIHNFPARGCTGFYQIQSGTAPKTATKTMRMHIDLPNFDPLDPFGR